MRESLMRLGIVTKQDIPRAANANAFSVLARTHGPHARLVHSPRLAIPAAHPLHTSNAGWQVRFSSGRAGSAGARTSAVYMSCGDRVPQARVCEVMDGGDDEESREAQSRTRAVGV
jgi:hypothetical protein